MSLNPSDLRRKIKIGNKNAIKIYPLRRRGNLLLTTLLVGNVAVNSILAVHLGSLTTGIYASIIATTLIVFFGEIIPQSLFAKHALKFGAKFTWLVYIFLYLFYPITKPISYVLDKTIGGEIPNSYSKKELHLLVEEQKSLGKSDLKDHEYAIIRGGLVFSEKRVKQVMTPARNCCVVNSNVSLTRSALVNLQKKGHSRIPVYDKKAKRVIGILYAKDLISIDPAENISVKKIMRKEVFHIHDHDKLDRVLNMFKKKRLHLFIVLNHKNKFAGIVTLEDVLEEIVGEIVDEHDHVVDMRLLDA